MEVKSLRQRQGGTFLRDHSIPRGEEDGGRETRFSPTLKKILFDLSDAVIHDSKIKRGFISFPSLFLLV